MIGVRRSILVCPGDKRGMVAKAATLPTDGVVLDLEDAVAADDESRARARLELAAALESLDFGGRSVAVRINAVGGPWALQDLLEIVPRVGSRLATVVVPKVSHPSEVGFVAHCLDALEAPGMPRLGIEIQIETAAGLEAVSELATSSPRLEALIFGPGDFAADMGMPQTVIGGQAQGYPGDVWHYPLTRIAVAARARGLQVIDGPYSRLADPAGLEQACRRAVALGVDGKWAIHPEQLATINSEFAPSPEQVVRAREMLAVVSAKGGASRLGEEMVDEANLRMARAVLARAREERA